ncbi:MAG TPA: hypothetical protein VJ499_11440 [Flavisolibacter sp.]|nr:hypothetical protein [Flavisolibacter sp.]
MSRSNNSNNPRERKAGMAKSFGTSEERSYSPSRSDRGKNDNRMPSNVRLELRKSDRENDLYERQSI